MGKPVPAAEKRVRIDATLHPTTLAMLDELAEEDASTRSAAIERLVRDEVKRRARLDRKA